MGVKQRYPRLKVEWHPDLLPLSGCAAGEGRGDAVLPLLALASLKLRGASLFRWRCLPRDIGGRPPLDRLLQRIHDAQGLFAELRDSVSQLLPLTVQFIP